MKIKKGFFVLISISLLTLSGCGDLFKKDVVKKPLENSRLKANCEMQVDRISKILVEPITSTLNCLEKNLNIFIEVSELGKGGKLSRVALKAYLKRNRPDVKPTAYPVIDSIFALAHLITGEEKDFISKKNVERIIELARKFNYHAYNNYKHTYGSELPANLSVHESHRKRVEDAAREIQLALEAIYVPERDGETHYLEIMPLIKSFITSGNTETIEKIEGLLFAKKILMGGQETKLSHTELGFIFSHLPKLLSLVLDAVRYKHLILEQKDVLRFINEDIIDLANILFHPSRGDRKNEYLFHVDQAINGIDRLLKEDKRISKYRQLIKEGKKILTQKKLEKGSPEKDELWVTGGDLERILNHGYNITAKGMVFHRLYESPVLKPLLDSPQSIYLDPKKYEINFPMEKAELHEFCRIVNNYRFMRGNFDLSFYSLEHHRNANAISEINMFEYLIRETFRYYGSNLSMGKDQMTAILRKFESELIEMDIILPRRADNTAETITLLGSLFQWQSDDNKVLDVDEATEFAITLVSAMDAKKEIYKFFETKVAENKCDVDEFNRIEPECFRTYFFEGICTRYRPHFPRLFEFLGADPELDCQQDFNSDHNQAYLDSSIQAARFCNIYPDDKEEIPYSEADIMSILIAMKHIETTIIRWDTNLNNLMDVDEVMNAYAIYEPAIQGMLPPLKGVLDKPEIKKTIAKLVYQYLVRFEEAPYTQLKEFSDVKKVWKTITNLTKLLKKKAPAHRKTIASILRVVSEQSKKKAIAAGIPQFDCNWLHDPENIPRD